MSNYQDLSKFRALVATGHGQTKHKNKISATLPFNFFQQIN